MTTTVSIDAVSAASATERTVPLGEAASDRLSEVSVSTARGGTQLPQDEAVSLFQQTLAEQTAENASLGETVRAAMVSVSETLAKLDAEASGATTTSDLGEATVCRLPEDGTSVAGGETVLPQADGETVLSQADGETALFQTDGETALSQADGETALSQADGETALPLTDGETASLPSGDEVADDPEVSAEALVAAGVASSAVTQSVETQLSQNVRTVVAPVDIVRAQATEAVAPASVLVQAAEAVADTLLVTPGLLRGQGEVVVQLRPDVLDGTEVKISVTGRQLDVVFQPQTVDMAVLIENCRSQLVQHLAAKIVSFNVNVDVRKKRG